MKELIFIFFAMQFSFFSFGQNSDKQEYITKVYPNGQLKEKKGYIEIINTPFKNGVIPPLTAYNTSSRQVGFWEYWYENGNKKLEKLVVGNRYINMWFSDGTQIMKNGNGYYSCYNNEKISDTAANEKIVFIVKDSIITNIKVVLKEPPYIK